LIPTRSHADEAPRQAICIAIPNRSEQQNLMRLIEDLGHEIIPLSSSETLLIELDAIEPCCLIADAELPGLPGIDLLRALELRHKCTPTILIGASGSIQSAVQAFRNGVRDYFDRPLRQRAFHAAVAAIVGPRPLI
jgi:FixJ family two-component response regulator